MIQKADSLLEDINKVKQIPIIPTLLEVVCRTTGLGFAAVARVTNDRWITCSVRDEIAFGLKEGEELRIETTICNEIRASRRAVIIDDVDSDEVYCDHPTPKMYGFKSYISVPIYLKDGSFFGTLCAVDPNPAKVKNSQTLGLFMLFADLISFHLQRIERLENNSRTVRQRHQRAAGTLGESRQYHYISDHNISESLRKLSMFSSLIVETAASGDMDKTKTLATKINSSADQFGMMLQDISHYMPLTDRDHFYEPLNLRTIVDEVQNQLRTLIHEKRAVVDVIDVPTMAGIRFHLEHLFYRLIHNALTFSRKDVPVLIQIYTHRMWGSELQDIFPTDASAEYLEIIVEDNGRGIEPSELEQIFHIFSDNTDTVSDRGYGMGLAHSSKIARFHGGFITAKSTVGQGSTFTVFLPVKPAPAYNDRA